MKLLFTFVLMFLLLACEPVSTYEPEARPNGIPASALWVGGPDGGVYVRMQVVDGNYSGTIYFDSTGEVWYEGRFIYSGNTPFDVSEVSTYSAWDGDTLYLVNGQKLDSLAYE